MTKKHFKIRNWKTQQLIGEYEAESLKQAVEKAVAFYAEERRANSLKVGFDEMYSALEAAEICLGEAGSDEHLKQMTNDELGKLWIATVVKVRAALRSAKGLQGGKNG